MPCHNPLPAFRGKDGIKFARGSTTWSDQAAIQLPCGQCLGCRMSKAQDWQTRLIHEAQGHERSSFLTLTYSDEHLPPDLSVNVRDLQLFMKRARKQAGTKLRFFACGEYGDTTYRPHYHVLLFGQDFPDRQHWRVSPAGHPLYRSAQLEKLWPFGNSELGTVTPDSAGYVARYCLKKVNGPAADGHYTRLNPHTGELIRVRPEFICMSTRPGIGADWLAKYQSDAFPSDFVVIDGSRKPVPKYYSRKLNDEKLALKMLHKRKVAARKHEANNTPERLATREEVLRLRALNLKRELE